MILQQAASPHFREVPCQLACTICTLPLIRSIEAKAAYENIFQNTKLSCINITPNNSILYIICQSSFKLISSFK